MFDINYEISVLAGFPGLEKNYGCKDFNGINGLFYSKSRFLNFLSIKHNYYPSCTS